MEESSLCFQQFPDAQRKLPVSRNTLGDIPDARLTAAPANPALNKAADAVEGPALLRAPR